MVDTQTLVVYVLYDSLEILKLIYLFMTKTKPNMVNPTRHCVCVTARLLWQSRHALLQLSRQRADRNHDDVIKWKHFPRYWQFVRGIHRSPVNSPHKGQSRGAIFFDLRLNKRLSKQSWGWWFETLSYPLWRQGNDLISQKHLIKWITGTYDLYLCNKWH